MGMVNLSIVIPAYNEHHKIRQDILAADRFLNSEHLSGEIIIVDDGSIDHTAIHAKQAAGEVGTDCVIERLDRNSGKGCAVRTGVLKSRGEFVLFADSGNCIPFSEVKIGLKQIQSGPGQIAHGSRRLKGQIMRPQSLYRRICSQLFHWFLIHDIKRLGNLTDTQCGFKVYRGDIARELYSQSTINGFMFDIEIILLALSKGYRIHEFPVDWAWDPDSRLKPMHVAWHVFRDVLDLKKRFGPFLRDHRP
jgi:dolichyl-phosphate beta-glucosyltransferase